jgi:hypothetical protein
MFSLIDTILTNILVPFYLPWATRAGLFFVENYLSQQKKVFVMVQK